MEFCIQKDHSAFLDSSPDHYLLITRGIQNNYEVNDRRQVFIQITDDGENFINSILETFAYEHSDIPSHHSGLDHPQAVLNTISS